MFYKIEHWLLGLNIFLMREGNLLTFHKVNKNELHIT